MKTFLRSLAIGTLIVATDFNLALAGTAAQSAPVHSAADASRVQAANAGQVHRVFGWLVRVDGQMLSLQLRSGRILTVDAARAYALNRVSAPLYHGKPTVVTGTVRGAVLDATSVVRAAPQAASWDIDR